MYIPWPSAFECVNPHVYRRQYKGFTAYIGIDDSHDNLSFLYGGTRLVPPSTDIKTVLEDVHELTFFESGLKNTLLNTVLRNGSINSFIGKCDEYCRPVVRAFADTLVGGARCLVQPSTHDLYSALRQPGAANFVNAATQVFCQIADDLESLQGLVKLTPDFGAYSGIADFMHRDAEGRLRTEHVLGIRCEDGGSGGKSSYTATGVLAALDIPSLSHIKTKQLTLIGSAGALGSCLLTHFLRDEANNLAICDLQYDAKSPIASVKNRNCIVLAAIDGCFTDACLRRPGLIIATTNGREFENSPGRRHLAKGTVLLLAHNLSLPLGEQGRSLAQEVSDLGCLLVPGQLLTLGGVTVSRLEWLWRSMYPGRSFDLAKPLAHELVGHIVKSILTTVLAVSDSNAITPYEAMLLVSGYQSAQLIPT